MLKVLVRNWDRWLTMEIRTLARAKLIPEFRPMELGRWEILYCIEKTPKSKMWGLLLVPFNLPQLVTSFGNDLNHGL